METSEKLQRNLWLPTPMAANQEGYQRSHGRKALRLGSILSRGAFPASLFPLLDKEQAQQTTAISGRKCLELFNLQNRDGSLLKTSLEYLLSRADWYSSRCVLIWKAKATLYSHLLFQLVPLMHPTDEIGYGLFATPTASDGKGAGASGRDNLENLIEKSARKGQPGTKTGLKLQPAFVEWMMGFPRGWTDVSD